MRISRRLCRFVHECVAMLHASLASIRKGRGSAASASAPAARCLGESESALGGCGLKCTDDFGLCRQPRTTSTTLSSMPGATPPPLLPSPLVNAAPSVYRAVPNA